MSEEDGVLPDKADDAWSGGLDDAGQSTARPATAGPGSAATGRPATEPGADADTCLERDQARPEPARAQLPEPGRRGCRTTSHPSCPATPEEKGSPDLPCFWRRHLSRRP